MQFEGYTACYWSTDECKGPGTLEKQLGSLSDRSRVWTRRNGGRERGSSQISGPPSPFCISKTLKIEEFEVHHEVPGK